MLEIKYAGIDLHQSTCLIAVHDEHGKTVSESIVETRAETVRDFFRGQSGVVHVAFEVGTQSAWLYEVLKSQVSSITVCDVRTHKRQANKSDRIDAHKLANLLRLGELKAVYQGDRNIRKLRDLAHGYLATVNDSIRVMNRIKALYRGWSIRCAGRDVYYKRNRQAWLSKFPIIESKMRAVLYYKQLDLLKEQRKEIKKAFLKEARRYPIQKILREIPGFGPIRAAFVIAVIGTPHRFRTNRQLWTYSGLSVVIHSTSDHEIIGGQIFRKQHKHATRGLTRDYNRILKMVFKSAAVEAIRKDPIKALYVQKISKGIRPEMATLSIARKLATITLVLWKRGEKFSTAKMISLN
jgi:transposase